MKKGNNNKFIKSKHILFVLYFCILPLSGCMVGPDFKAPEPNMPDKWVGQAGTQGVEPPDKILLKWWTQFDDANIVSLIDRALESNLDIRQAEQRIRQARATLGVVSSSFWPTASVTADYTRSRSGGPIPDRQNLFQTGFDSIWELDVFGGVRRDIESAEADIQASIEDRRDVLVSLAAEVATSYVQLRGYQQEIIIARNNLQSQQQSARVVRQRFEGGFVSALDTANADAQVATTLSQIPLLEASAQQSIYTLSVLLGLPPQSLLEELSPESSIPLTPPEVPTGLPSEILRRRPDIRRAEAQIHSATAQIGVATADLFPKFNLMGSISVQADRPRGLGWSQRSWVFGPSADWQIFSAGRVRSNIEIQKALHQQALLAYEKTVLTALQEVENALISYDREHQRNKALINAVNANRKAVELSTQLYAEGQTEFLSVLDAQRSLYNSEDSLAQSTRNLSTNLIALYKALGGGWDSYSIKADLITFLF